MTTIKRRPLTEQEGINLTNRKKEIQADPKYRDDRYKYPLIQEMDSIQEKLLFGIPLSKPTLNKQQISELQARKKEIIKQKEYRNIFENQPLIDEVEEINGKLFENGVIQ